MSVTGKQPILPNPFFLTVGRMRLLSAVWRQVRDRPGSFLSRCPEWQRKRRLCAEPAVNGKILNMFYPGAAGLWPGIFIIPGTYGICGGTNTAGALTQWMGEQWYRDAKKESRFHRMEMEASAVPAGIEGICYTIRDNVNLMRAHGLPMGRIFAVGGGTKNALWLQCLADILEQEICVPAVSFGAAYGDALMAALAGGAFLDWKELSDRIQVKKIYAPNPENFAVYRKQGHIFNKLYEVTKDHMHQLSGSI